MTLEIVAGSSVPGLARGIAAEAGVKAHFPRIEVFPDGEVHVEVPGLSGLDTVAYVQTMHPRPNDLMAEALITSSLLKELGVKRLIAVIPYLAYTRQDTRHEEGEAIAVKTALRALKSAGVDDILSVDIHLHRLGLQDLSKMSGARVYEASAVDLLARAAGKYLDRPVVIGPDSESERWAKRASEILGGSYDVLEKHRLSPTEIEIRPKSIEASGQDFLVIDDIVSTGHTIVEVIRSLRSRGARKIGVAFSHAVMSGDDAALGLLRAGADYMISTNSIINEFSAVDLSPVLAEKLREIV